MTEPKVVHEWFGGTGAITNLYRVDDHGAITCQNPNDESEYVKPNLFSIGRELARLAARVQELEALGDADAFRDLADAHNELRDHNVELLAENKRLREPACDCLIHGLRHRQDCPRKP